MVVGMTQGGNRLRLADENTSLVRASKPWTILPIFSTWVAYVASVFRSVAHHAADKDVEGGVLTLEHAVPERELQIRDQVLAYHLLGLTVTFAMVDGPLSDAKKAYLARFFMPLVQHRAHRAEEEMEALIRSVAEGHLKLEYFCDKIKALSPDKSASYKDILTLLFEVGEVDAPLSLRGLQAWWNSAQSLGADQALLERVLRERVVPRMSAPEVMLGVAAHRYSLTLPMLKAAYLRALSAYHPDRFRGAELSPACLALFHERFRILNGAYQALKSSVA